MYTKLEVKIQDKTGALNKKQKTNHQKQTDQHQQDKQ